MRRAISVILAAVLVTTPLKLVLAQAGQQEAVSVQRTAPPDSTPRKLTGKTQTGNLPQALGIMRVCNDSVVCSAGKPSVTPPRAMF